MSGTKFWRHFAKSMVKLAMRGGNGAVKNYGRSGEARRLGCKDAHSIARVVWFTSRQRWDIVHYFRKHIMSNIEGFQREAV